jgi:signal transduction histidine kinase
LFRIASEALANVRRHAGARRVELSLGGDGAAVALTIDDDGCGLVQGVGDGRYGIVGMQERAAALGGTFAIGPRPGGGTRVDVRVPVTD